MYFNLYQKLKICENSEFAHKILIFKEFVIQGQVMFI